MSAWIVNKEHIALLVEACFRYEVDGLEGQSPDELGALLWHENHVSVNYRYDEDTPCPAYEHDASAVKQWVKDAPFLFKQINCYSYQTCEHPEWEASLAYAIVDALRDAVLRGSGKTETELWKLSGELPWGVDVALSGS